MWPITDKGYIRESEYDNGYSPSSSYGRSSPSTQFDTSCFITNRGGVFDEHNDGDSYGMIYTANKKFKFRSPDLYDDISNACRVDSSGFVGHYWNVTNSYG